ncbi:lipofamily protein [Clostridium sp. Sa3CUN1]|uniref:Lipofamily protein n=1 Tax=Clostridium gallinarum TaxID=2762246 RepID=A0ABR8Q699_9CLOT|nr:lipofamily protein [Clostridium gallinarum]MBD7915929.1 lipofamily protein [Clostridium gallinarum]
MKFKSLIIPMTVLTLLSVGCGKTDNNANENNTNVIEENNKPNTDSNGGTVDMVTAPSRATDEANLIKAVKESWIVILENNITTSQEITLETGFKKSDKDNPSDLVDTPRVIALYRQNDNKEVVDNYTLELPKLIIKDEGAKIEGGTIKGDIYIEARNVKIEGTTVDGNIYFSNEEEKNTFHMDENSKVLGSMEVK